MQEIREKEEIKIGYFEGSMEEIDSRLKKSLVSQQQEFVRTGWLLRSAEITEKYKEFGYNSLTEYAKEKLNMDKDLVSRYKNINEKYAEGGCSEFLKKEYRGYAYTQLSEMLTLPNEIAESIPVETTRREIQQIKKEIQEEKEITDIEVALEQPQKTEIPLETLAEKAIYQQLKDNESDFNGLFESTKIGLTKEAILDVLAPTGVTTILPRVPKLGKVMISVRGLDENIDFINTRTMEKESIDWTRMVEIVNKIFYDTAAVPDPAKAREIIFGEVAPVQPDTKEAEKSENADNYSNSKTQEDEKEEKRVIEETHTKKEKEKSEKRDKHSNSKQQEKVEKVEGEIVDEIPGQAVIGDYKEAMPDGVKSNYEKYMEKKEEIAEMAKEIMSDVEEDNYAKLKWDAKKLAKTMEEIYHGE